MGSSQHPECIPTPPKKGENLPHGNTQHWKKRSDTGKHGAGTGWKFAGALLNGIGLGKHTQADGAGGNLLYREL